MADAAHYLTLKLAQELYRKPPESLAPDERQRVARVAARQLAIEQRILAAPEAAQVVLPLSSVDQGVAEIRGRYAAEEDYVADLAKSELDPASLRAAIERDLRVEAVLDRVGSQAAVVSDTDVEIFYLMNRKRFLRPETRTLRHILVTINDAVAGSERPAARARIGAIAARLERAPERFAEQALKHSECPTAMNGGLLGTVVRGQLFAELEPVAFALGLGQLSGIVESPLGFHILRCDAIEAESELPLASVRDKVRSQLADSRRRAAQRAWIAGLFQPA